MQPYRDVNLVSISLTSSHVQFNFVYIVSHDIFIWANANNCTGKGSECCGSFTMYCSVVLFMDLNRGGMKSQNAEMQVTLKLASYFHTNVRDLSQYTWFSCYALYNERLPDAHTNTHIAMRELSIPFVLRKMRTVMEEKQIVGHCWKTNCICNLFTIILPFHIYWN